MNLVAKPIIKDQYWVITDGKKKIGNVIAEGTEYQVKMDDKIETYDSTNTISKLKKIEFQRVGKINPPKPPSFATYPTTGDKIYNSYYDVKRKLHIYTKTPKSKCYHVAGWFAIKQNDEYVNVFCPKYIFIQRYDYVGPFMSESEIKVA